jgi:hypothetical protein
MAEPGIRTQILITVTVCQWGCLSVEPLDILISDIDVSDANELVEG